MRIRPVIEEGGEAVCARNYAGASTLRRSNGSEARRPPRSDLGLIERAGQALEVLHGKWKVHLLFFMARGIHRHSRLLDCLPGVSKKVMTDSLRALERDGLVARNIFAEVPVRVEYSLTPLGWSLTEPLIALADWGDAHAAEVVEARTFALTGRSGRLGERLPARPFAVA